MARIRIPSDRPVLSTPDEADVAQYRAVCGLAVVGSIVGLLSFVAVFAPMLWIVPALGVVLGILALRRIARETPTLVGRKAALMGLALSLVFAVAAPTEFFYYRWLLRQEARQFAGYWFEYLLNKEPHKAHQLTDSAAGRQPLDEKLWEYYPTGAESREALEGYVARPVVRAILTLGNQAHVRFYNTESQSTENERDIVVQSFAVTFSSEGEPKTFFVRLVMERSQIAGKRKAGWRVVRDEGGLPAALGGKSVS